MLQWLLDGSGLLVGAVLFDPTSGSQQTIAPADARLAPGVEGAVAVLVADDEGSARVSVSGGPHAFGPVAIDLGDTPYRVLGWVDGEVYVAATDFPLVETRCWSVTAEGPRRRERCIEASLPFVSDVVPAGDQRYVVYSHGEGHPWIDLFELTDAGARELPLPWDDLYPFGPLTLAPRVDGTFDILTPCVLGVPRPCLMDGRTVADELPPRHYRWQVGSEPRLLARGRKGDRVPDPSSARVAWRSRKRVCIAGDGRRRCFEVAE